MNALILKKGREKSLKRRHPWIFSGAIERVIGKPQAGDTVDIIPLTPFSNSIMSVATSRGTGGGLCTTSWPRTRAIGPMTFRNASRICRPAPVMPPPGDSAGESTDRLQLLGLEQLVLCALPGGDVDHGGKDPQPVGRLDG